MHVQAYLCCTIRYDIGGSPIVTECCIQLWQAVSDNSAMQLLLTHLHVLRLHYPSGAREYGSVYNGSIRLIHSRHAWCEYVCDVPACYLIM